MKKYNITVNGVTYAVEVEEVGGVSTPAAAPVPAPAAPVAPVAPAAPAPAPAAPAAPAAGGNTVTSPMPGTVLNIKVAAGQSVNAGDVLLILEAMKMENEINAPAAGTIDTVAVAAGQAVNAGDVLFTLK